MIGKLVPYFKMVGALLVAAVPASLDMIDPSQRSAQKTLRAEADMVLASGCPIQTLDTKKANFTKWDFDVVPSDATLEIHVSPQADGSVKITGIERPKIEIGEGAPSYSITIPKEQLTRQTAKQTCAL